MTYLFNQWIKYSFEKKINKLENIKWAFPTQKILVIFLFLFLNKANF